MHELGLCSSLVDVIERRAGERPVQRVRVRVGRLNHVHPEAFDQSFAIATKGTIAEGAAAELVLIPISARCASCGANWQCDDLPLACPQCASLEIDLVGGDDFVLELIEYRI